MNLEGNHQADAISEIHLVFGSESEDMEGKYL